MGGGVPCTLTIFARFVLLVSQNPYPIIVYSAANYRPNLCDFCQFGYNFELRILLFLNPLLTRIFLSPKNAAKYVQPHSNYCIENVMLL